MEEEIVFMSEAYKLEGLFSGSNREYGAVVTHPHPLYGGDMHNYVVEKIVDAYANKGYATLRFNFRGVGGSGGNHGNGVGEKQDVLAAVEFLVEMGVTYVDLSGYSFGAWVNAHVDCTDSVRKITMVSPPAAFMDFSQVSSIPQLDFAVTGGRDDIAPPDMVRQLLPKWNPNARLEIIDGADHFYGGYIQELESALNKNIV